MVTDRILDSRKLTAEFISISDDYKGSLSIRNTLYRLLCNDGYFFIVESEIPHKRWRVYPDDWNMDRRSPKVQTFEVTLLCENGFSETVNLISRSYTTTYFKFNNEGDLTIDPRIHSEVSIEFSGVSNNLIIKNNTTGDEWSWNGTTLANDVLSLNGIKSLKNGVSIFGQTNKKLLKIIPGWNDFQLIGTSELFTITVKTRFYFL